MKNLKTLLLIAIFTLGIGNALSAQKTAHINFEELISKMPETDALQVEMEKLSKTYKDEITGMAKKLEATMKKYQAEQATQTQVINETRGQEVQQERARIQQAEQAAYQDMQKRQNEKLAPIVEKARKAINDVAAEKGIVYVLDATEGRALLVFDKGVNLYEAVKVKLGF
jgi:outer membrane protein